MNIFDRIRKRYAKVTPLPVGVHHFQSAPDAAHPYRIHLRLEGDGSGVLIVNAATVLHLNPTAAEYAHQMITGADDESAARAIAARYRVSKQNALTDYRDFVERVQTLIDTPDLDPVSFLDFERIAPHATDLSAPLRLDCALTYRLTEGANPLNAPLRNVTRELTTAEWVRVIDLAWEHGIPHIVFTGGEPTLRADLPDLIARAEKNGQVTGLLTDGQKLSDAAYLDSLLQTGLDHLLFILQPEDENDWRALDNALKADLFVTVHVTITDQNVAGMDALLQKLAGLGVTSLSLSAAPNLHEALHSAQFAASDLLMSLVWDLPVPYSAANPISLETAEDEAPSGAGRAWLYIEPDGDVLPGQGADQKLGNILKDDWQEIWKRI
jgi:hypothetical protein